MLGNLRVFVDIDETDGSDFVIGNFIIIIKKCLSLFRPDSDSVFRLKSNFNKKIDPDFHHSQEGLKFPTQISPLLNSGLLILSLARS